MTPRPPEEARPPLPAAVPLPLPLAPIPPPRRRLFGYAGVTGPVLLVVAGVCATIESICVRLLSPQTGIGHIVLFRSAFQFLVCAVLILGWFGPGSLKTSRPGSHLLRGGLSAMSWWLYYVSFRSLDLALATTLSFSAQIFVVALAALVLGERITLPRVVATLTGFAGVAIATGIWNVAAFDVRVVYGIGAALISAVVTIVTRSLSQTERTPAILFYMSACVLASAIPQVELSRPPSLSDAVILLALSIVGTAGAWLQVDAYRRAEASALAPYPYTRLIVATVAGAALFGELISPATLVGAALIVGSTLFVMMADRGRARTRA